MADPPPLLPEFGDLLRGLLGIDPTSNGAASKPKETKQGSSGNDGSPPHIYRQRIYHLIPYGHFEEVLQLCEQLNAIARARGGTGGSLWIPTIGAQNELIVEFEFTELASLQAGRAARNQDPEWTALIRKIGAAVVPGSVRTELWETAPHLADGDP